MEEELSRARNGGSALWRRGTKAIGAIRGKREDGEGAGLTPNRQGTSIMAVGSRT